MEKTEYYCIFDKKQPCPVKEEYKLKPESLNEFCKICSHSASKQQEAKIFEMISLVVTQFIGKIMDSQKDKEQLSYQLGRMTATAEMLQTRLNEITEKDISIEELKAELEKLDAIKKLRELGSGTK